MPVITAIERSGGGQRRRTRYRILRNVSMLQPLHRLVAALVVGLALLGTAPFAARQDVTPTNVTSMRAAEFFASPKVWTAHLSMSAEAWRAMQPRYGSAGGGGGFGDRFLGPPGGRN